MSKTQNNEEQRTKAASWPETSSLAPVLSVRDLHVSYGPEKRSVPAVRGVSFDVLPGQTLGIVGESGSGKSTTVLGMLGLLGPAGHARGEVLIRGKDFLTATARERRRILGLDVGVVYQDALRSLNPVLKVGKQITELLEAHGRSEGAREKVVDLLKEVGIPDPRKRANQYPHEYSGGMRQRAMIAMGLALSPSILVADEPTTALDVTIQAQVLDLIRRLAAGEDTATVIVTHDLGVIAGMSDRVLVMYGGEVVEEGPTQSVFAAPRHPYTAMLLRAMPSIESVSRNRLEFIAGHPPAPDEIGEGCPFAPRCYAVQPMCLDNRPVLKELASRHAAACFVSQQRSDGFPPKPGVIDGQSATETSSANLSGGIAISPQITATDPETPLLRLDNVTRRYGSTRLLRAAEAPVVAVDGLSLTVERGESLGLVGESGCGKSTLGRLIVGLERPDEGSIRYDGVDIASMNRSKLREFRRHAQMIYQDPRSSLNRRMTVKQILSEPLAIRGIAPKDREAAVVDLLQTVGLRAQHRFGLPNEFSGGQAQRIAIARALALNPSLLVADEAVSSLDVSVQGQVLNLLRDIQERLGLSVLFIAHDLAVVRQVCDRVAVMYLGKIVEMGPADDLFARPRHPYTAALRSAHPIPDPVRERKRERILLTGDAPSPSAIPSGCRFHPRCPIGPAAKAGRDICREVAPPLERGQGNRPVACHFADEMEVS